MIIKRREMEELSKAKGWLLIFGRRKVGKTFLVKNSLRPDAYFLVRRDLSILAEGAEAPTSLTDFSERVRQLLKKQKTVAIDEFQRLPFRVLEDISTAHPNGKLILTGSSLRVIHRIFATGAPLLGLVSEHRIGLISPTDVFLSLCERLPPEQALRFAPYVRDPWTVEFFRWEDPLTEVYDLLQRSKLSIPALIGEVFLEEERELTSTYEAILRLVGAGRWRMAEIAGSLHARGLLERPDPRAVAPYVKNMQRMGLLESVGVFNLRASYLKVESPIIEAFFYLADRYGFDERDVGLAEAKPTLRRLLAMHVQDFIGWLLAELYGGRREYYFTPSEEIDVLVTVRRKPVVIAEVKTGKVGRAEIARFKENTRQFPTAEKLLVCWHPLEAPGIKTITPKELLEMCRKSAQQQQTRVQTGAPKR
jgi:hypothetical protein